MVLDINKVCRLCLEISSNSIFYPGNSNGHQNNLNEDLVSRIYECTSLKVAAGDGLPESICDACVGLINKFVLFRKMCWEVDDKLRGYFFSSNDKNEHLSSLVNPIRLDPDQIERPCEVKDAWMCGSSEIKGEQDISEDEPENDIDGSDEEYFLGDKTSQSKDTKLKFSCDLCDVSFHRMSELKNHKDEGHPKTRKSKPIMTCCYCNKSFKQMKRYNDHVSAHENPLGVSKEEQETKQSRRRSAGDTDSDSQEDVRSEVKKEEDDENHEDQSTEVEAKPKKKKVRKVYDCEYCDQVFHSQAKYIQHELSHTGEKKYNCSDCSRSFTHKHSLIGHIKEQHTGEVNFTCDVCGRGFVHQSTYNIHKKTHSTEKPLKCPDCEKCFTQMKNLRVHRQIHSASRSHTCQVCGKSFNFLKTLKVHLVLHSGEKPYVCTYCGKAFAQSAPLKTHTRIHTGEKPYECTVCPLRFSTNNALKSHLLKHSGEPPYSCSVCSKGFTRKKDMVAHQEDMHEVYIGLPGQNNIVAQPAPSQAVQENCLPPQTNCLPPPLHPLAPPLLTHTHISSPHQSPSHMPHILPPHHHSHVNHHLVPLHPMSHQPPPHLPLPPHLPPAPNCMPHPAHYSPPQHRTDMPGADCSGG